MSRSGSSTLADLLWEVRRARRHRARHRGRYPGARSMTDLAKHQLAGLAALDAMIAIAMRALVASYPAFGREIRPTDSDEVRSAAALSISAVASWPRSITTVGSSLVSCRLRIGASRSDRHRARARYAAAARCASMRRPRTPSSGVPRNSKSRGAVAAVATGNATHYWITPANSMSPCHSSAACDGLDHRTLAR